ncbi:LemA family protein [Saprospira sp. CCB-QB6]|uniref:LemA family protein n=1 Tax=Saprospira sp. CCB-QB6 TaxID=3023936 RepID=UPI00234BF12C|nr:LemA family protein [Saprospira sp. CCB-QB6]WCL81095.1 LemA family protein [Saprospira sp. CCB-QB6]
MAKEQQSILLEKYVEQLLALQAQKQEAPLNLSELKEIAESIGLSESDWQEAQNTVRQQTKIGQKHINIGNFPAAIQALQLAVNINPLSEQALFYLAQAHQLQFAETGKKENLLAAQEYAQRVLQNNDPQLDAASIELMNTIKDTAEKQQRGKWLRLGIVATVLVVLGLGANFYYFSSKQAILQEEQKLQKQWAQVENVYQRRLDLLPKLGQLLSQEESSSKAKLEEIQQLESQLNRKNLVQYAQQQADLSQKINELLQGLDQKAQLYRDIQIQIEGAENRISVEKRKYNEKVGEYNQFVIQFPYNLLSDGPKPYYQTAAAGKDAQLLKK